MPVFFNKKPDYFCTCKTKKMYNSNTRLYILKNVYDSSLKTGYEYHNVNLKKQ